MLLEHRDTLRLSIVSASQVPGPAPDSAPGVHIPHPVAVPGAGQCQPGAPGGERGDAGRRPAGWYVCRGPKSLAQDQSISQTSLTKHMFKYKTINDVKTAATGSQLNARTPECGTLSPLVVP